MMVRPQHEPPPRPSTRVGGVPSRKARIVRLVPPESVVFGTPETKRKLYPVTMQAPSGKRFTIHYPVEREKLESLGWLVIGSE